MRRLSLIFATSLVIGCGGEAAQHDAPGLERDLQLAEADSSAAPLADVPAPEEQPQEAVLPEPAPRTPTSRRTPPPPPPPPSPVTVAPAPAPAPPPPAPEPEPIRSRSLSTGTTIVAAALDTITSRKNKPGETFSARIGSAVVNEAGETVIPAGATVTLSIVELAPAANKGDSLGKLVLRPTRVTFGGESYPLVASVTNVEYTLKGRGVTAGDAAKVGIGAAAGAIAGRILGGKGKGAVVGGVVGAAAGTAVAVETADRDVLIVPGAKVTVVLRGALSVPVS